MEWIRDLKDITKGDVALAGGKGASLGELMHAGMPVPRGFVVLSAAYEQFQAEGKMPSGVAEEIKDSFAKLGARQVAVRSSATAEDSKQASWAGQLDSYLNTTEGNLLENVQKCWESLESARANFYRSEQGLADAHISVAVVVQEMIESEVAGVAFSVHPVTEDPDQIIIEAGFGLGEAVVGGTITPDRYVVAKSTGKIVEKEVQMQDTADQQKLSDKDILRLAKLVEKIETHYGFPVDVEWAFAGGKFSIVQSRPITTLHGRKNESKALTTLPEIRSAEFWARESSMPLFWLTDTRHDMGPESLIFYKNKSFHFFYLNDSQNKNTEKGSKFFSQKQNVIQYEKTANEFIHDVEVLRAQYQDFSFKELKTEELAVLFASLGEKLFQFGDLYLKTESANTKDLGKHGIDLENLARLRLELRKGFSSLFGIFIGQLVRELARRNRLNVKGDLFFYNASEISALVHTGEKVEESIILERRRGYAVLRNDAAAKLFPKKDADVLWKKVNDLMLGENSREIKGTVVFGGIVRGKVRVIQQSFNKKRIAGGYGIQPGEILVTDMTKPDMMLACKRSAAIVTDEGGVISHASILARELEKTCIVGTKIATQVLKTGDLVEVDAEEGIVRIIQKARR